MPDVYIIDTHSPISANKYASTHTVKHCDNEVNAMNLLADCDPAVVLLNFSVRSAGTAEYIELLSQANPSLKIIVVGNNLADKDIIPCIYAGAIGYQNENKLAHFFSKMIAVVQAGEAWVSRRLIAAIVDNWRQQHLAEV